MLLTIDVGNTHTVLGLFDGEDIVEHWRISTDSRRTADELAVLLQGLMGMHPLLGEELGDGIDGIAICATVPSVLHELREVTRRYYGDVPAVLVEPGVKTGVPILTDHPKEVGADRIINSVAAVELYGGPAIVVDFGTATTFDAVSARGEYIGGVIAPGIEISVEALGVKGAQLRKIEVARPRSVIGKNTVEAMQSGIVYGFAGQVDGVVNRMARELADDPDDVTVIATGGLAPMVLGESSATARSGGDAAGQPRTARRGRVGGCPPAAVGASTEFTSVADRFRAVPRTDTPRRGPDPPRTTPRTAHPPGPAQAPQAIAPAPPPEAPAPPPTPTAAAGTLVRVGACATPAPPMPGLSD